MYYIMNINAIKMRNIFTANVFAPEKSLWNGVRLRKLHTK